jgi:alcohol dehydrogenase
MKAAYYDTFKGPISIRELPDPEPGPDDVIIKVMATGLCRSDWHGWQGHDSDVKLPHVPGHEFAGLIVATGKNIRNWKLGDRVTVPFCLGCGTCPTCQRDQQQICDNYYQPGFTGWGSFAELVRIPFAETNLVRLPDQIGFNQAAILGCRFITAWRGIYHQGNVVPGQYVAVFGCGGVGNAAIQIASALQAIPIAVDIDDAKLDFARKLGAAHTLNARTIQDIPSAIRDLTGGGAHLSIDALGSRQTSYQSILSLRKQGRHIQLGLLAGKEKDPPLPMSEVIARELQIVGSHGMQAHEYPALLSHITSGKIDPGMLIGKIVSLEEGAAELMTMGEFPQTGITVIKVHGS